MCRIPSRSSAHRVMNKMGALGIIIYTGKLNVREHPFNLKGVGGLWFFVGKKFLSALIEKRFLSLKWAEKKILLALKKYCFCRKKIMSVISNFVCENSPPPPLS